MLERETGVCEPFKIAKRLGVELTHPTGPAPERVPTFTLGVANASPLEMAEAYATFAGRGLHCDSRPVTSIEDATGANVKNYDSSCQQALPEATADAVNDVLRGVQEPGGFGYDIGHTGLNVPSAAKTGTTTDGKSVWYVGYTPQIATAAMIAGASKDGGRPIALAGQTIGGSYIYEVSGSGFAGPMWAQAMQAIQGNLDYEDFVAPSQTAVVGVSTAVPSVSGMSVGQAESVLQDAGFNAIEGGSVASGSPAGTVAYTTPSGGSYAPAGSVITMYTSTGVAPPPPPSSGGGGGGGGNGGGNGGGGDNGGGNGPGRGPGR
jgi:membrane peptidoglycan carboxypeptidase